MGDKRKGGGASIGLALPEVRGASLWQHPFEGKGGRGKRFRVGVGERCLWAAGVGYGSVGCAFRHRRGARRVADLGG
jgi:hypothetical protein